MRSACSCKIYSVLCMAVLLMCINAVGYMPYPASNVLLLGTVLVRDPPMLLCAHLVPCFDCRMVPHGVSSPTWDWPCPLSLGEHSQACSLLELCERAFLWDTYPGAEVPGQSAMPFLNVRNSCQHALQNACKTYSPIHSPTNTWHYPAFKCLQVKWV